MIKFLWLRYKNILSAGNSFTTIDLHNYKATVVVGANGAGKSTMIDALTFALYNKAFRKINKPQLVNTVNERELLVEVEFETKGSHYLVRRGIKPAIFEIFKDGKQYDSDLDLQKILEKQILCMSSKTMQSVAIAGSSLYTPFMQLKPAERRTVIEDLLDINIFSIMNVLAKQRLNNKKEELKESSYETKLIADRIQHLEETLKSLEENNQKEIDDLKSEIKNARSNIKEHEDKVEEYIETYETFKHSKDELESAQKEKKKLNTYQVKLDTKRKGYRKDRKFYDDHETCPTCEQDIDSEFREKMLKEIEENLESIDRGNFKLSKKFEEVNKKIESLEEEVHDYTVATNSVTQEKRRIKFLEESIEKMEAKIEKLESSDGLLEDTKRNLDKSKTELEMQRKSKIDIASQLEIFEHVSELLKDDGIKSRIIRKFIPVINERINFYLTQMEFFVTFTIDENFNEVIKSRHRDTFVYENFSQGEKARIDLALLLTWRDIAKIKVSVDTNLFILDETFDGSMDLDGSDYFSGVLHNMNNDTNIFIITHNEKMAESSLFNRTLRFEKRKNFSVYKD